MTDTTILGLSALAVICVSGFLWFRAAMTVRLPENRTYFVIAWGIAVALASVALAGTPGWLGGIAATFALLAGAFVLLTVSISRQSMTSSAVGKGDRIPQFSAPDDTGALFSSVALAGTPLLIKFFRGHW